MAPENLARSRAGHRPRARALRFLLATVILSALALCVVASTASAATPSVNNLAATNVDYTSATLNGDVNPNGSETKAYFEYGTTKAYGSKTAEVSVGSGSSPVEVSKAISGLTPNTEYHYRIVATNGSGTSQGADRTFVLGWKVQTTATPENTTIFEDVSCSSATECTAVGEAEVQRWNGTEWKVQTVPKPEGAKGINLTGVSCVSSSACTAVGSYTNASSKMVTLAEFWNGSEWKVQSTPNPTSTAAQLEDVSCTSATACTAVGIYWKAGPPETQETFAMRWNGTEWKLQTTSSPSTSSVLTSVSCTSSSFCMATGYYYESPSGPWTPLAERWNGTEWTVKAPQKPAGATMSWLFGVSCTSSTECTAVGDKEINAGTHEHETMAQRWNGTEWKLQTTPNPEAINRRVEDISCISATICTAVGYYTNNLGGEQPMALRWNGTEWTLQLLLMPAGATRAQPRSVSCVASRGCEAVGINVSSLVPFAEGYWRGAPPTVTTQAASSVAEKGATLNGDVNPNGTETKTYFEYGTTTSYGTKTVETNAGSGTSPVEKSQAISGLSPNTTYHYRIVANNENPETSFGADATFTTIGPPTVTTGVGEPDPATGKAATLNAFVDPNGQSTTYQFEYGTSPGSYSTTVPIPAESAGSEMSGKPVSYKITGLNRNTKYYFRVTATNASGKVNGAEKSFVTQDVPAATTLAASEVESGSATLNAFIDANGEETKYQFEYGTTMSYGSKAPVPPEAFGPEPETGSVEQGVSELEDGTVYHYRIVAENQLGTTYGADETFTTLPAMTLNVESEFAEVGTPLKALSFSLVFESEESVTHTCPEAQFSGEVTENPGAQQSVSTAKVGGLGCTYLGFLKVKYVIPTEGMALEYTTDESGEEGVANLSKFTLVGSVFFGAFQVGTCEYEVEMSGTYQFEAPLLLELAGEVEQIEASGTCPPGGTVSGEFQVTSGESSVEAEA